MSHSLVLRERQRERGEGGLIACHVACVCLYKGCLSLILFFFFFVPLFSFFDFHDDFESQILGLDSMFPTETCLHSWDSRHFFFSAYHPSFCFPPSPPYPSHCFCFLLCTRHRVSKCIQQVRFVSCHSFISFDHDSIHYHQPEIKRCCWLMWHEQVCKTASKFEIFDL